MLLLLSDVDVVVGCLHCKSANLSDNRRLFLCCQSNTNRRRCLSVSATTGWWNKSNAALNDGESSQMYLNAGAHRKKKQKEAGFGAPVTEQELPRWSSSRWRFKCLKSEKESKPDNLTGCNMCACLCRRKRGKKESVHVEGKSSWIFAES